MNRTEKLHKEENPLVTANILSRLTFWWLKDIFKIGSQRPIEEKEIYEVKDGIRSDRITRRFNALWTEEKRKKHPSLIRVMWKIYGLQYVLWGLAFSIFETILRVMQPLCLGGLVSYFVPGQTELTKSDAYWYATGIVMCALLMVVSFHPFILWVFRISAKLRLGCSGLIYQKTLKLSKSSIEDGLNGKVINILSTDLAKFDTGLAFAHDIWKGPMETIVFAYFIYLELDIFGMVGVAFLTCFVPLQAWIGKKAAQLRLQTAKRTDFRVRVMNEIILGIQVIKMYAWEGSFATMVDRIRKKEVNAIRGISYIRATITAFSMISRLSIFLSLAAYVYYDNLITARKVFIVSSYFTLLNWSMVYFWPVALTHVAEAYISAKRVQEFLLKSEDKPRVLIDSDHQANGKSNGHVKNGDYRRKNIVADKENGIILKFAEDQKSIAEKRTINTAAEVKGLKLNALTAAWTMQGSGKGGGIFDINLNVVENSLCAVVGQVGSGKSTLLNVILGELTLDSGSIDINGTLSYSGQEPWLFEGSIRNNIIFVDDYDEKRYLEVVSVCALERDFKLLPQGDRTIVGERGVSLSGGQRARVNLARAIYKKADIYLLDDPLSAVDTHVGKHIFDKCIKDYLRDKTRVLVTHQLQYLQNLEHVVIMNNGRVETQGSYADLKKKNKESFLSLSAMDETGTGEAAIETKIKKSTSFVEEAGDDDELIDREEKQASGGINLEIYKIFLKAVNSAFYVVIVFGAFVLAQIAVSGSEYFVSQWVNWEEQMAASATSFERRNTTLANNSTDSLNDTIAAASNDTDQTIVSIAPVGDMDAAATRTYYMVTYAVIMAVATVVYLFRSFAFFKLCLRVSINLHDKLFRGISRAKMLFYNTNPSGRILNRFARDISNVDSLLPMVLIDCIDFVLNFGGIMVIVTVINFWLMIPTLLMIILFYLLRTYYVRAGRSLKRIEALTRSPIFSHMNATLQGLSTVRGFKAEAILEKEFHEHQDHNTSAWYLFMSATRGFAVWLDMICVVYIGFVTYSFLLFAIEGQSGNIGLAISSAINLIGMCQWGMRQSAELENQMTSVERIVEYANAPSEPALETEKKNQPPKGWPEQGNVSFNGLSLRYVENTRRVLRNLTFSINAREKVGIVGRTGAGKSSMIQAIFRLAHSEGQILIDGVDIATLGLHDLRKNVSIIPQDPVLFSGSLRFNLDPFDEKSDAEMWHALEQVELKEAVSSLAGGIDCKMLDGGSNFSMGQRQLVCLARAILRNNKILILDEATANVDPETDKLIQNTIRNKFAECTVLTIAHRLHTVMDYDRVLVVDAGEIVEFDHPYELVQKQDGFFRRLVEQTGSATSFALMQSAKESYEKGKKHD